MSFLFCIGPVCFQNGRVRLISAGLYLCAHKRIKVREVIPYVEIVPSHEASNILLTTLKDRERELQWHSRTTARPPTDQHPTNEITRFARLRHNLTTSFVMAFCSLTHVHLAAQVSCLWLFWAPASLSCPNICLVAKWHVHIQVYLLPGTPVDYQSHPQRKQCARAIYQAEQRVTV